MIKVNRVKNSKGLCEFGIFFNIDTKLKYMTVGISFVKSLMFIISWGGEMCQKNIDYVGIKDVYYTNENGEIVLEKTKT